MQLYPALITLIAGIGCAGLADADANARTQLLGHESDTTAPTAQSNQADTQVDIPTPAQSPLSSTVSETGNPLKTEPEEMQDKMHYTGRDRDNGYYDRQNLP